MKDIAQSPQPDTAARLEGRILAVVVLSLVGIGFWQHYTDYVEAEQRGDFVANVQMALGSESGSSMAARWPHANIRLQASDISWRDCRYRPD
jgi:hypothetical protein